MDQRRREGVVTLYMRDEIPSSVSEKIMFPRLITCNLCSLFYYDNFKLDTTCNKNKGPKIANTKRQSD